jgi:uncharacterized repeat protein (TIGR01451 family)
MPSSSTPTHPSRGHNAPQRQLKNLLANGKRAVNGARLLRLLPVITVLALGICLAPLFRARAANLSSGPSGLARLLSTAKGYHLVPPSMANYLMPPDENSPNPSDGDPGPSADLAVTKTTGSESATADSNVTYTIQIRNIGSLDAANATINDDLPGGMTFVSLTQNSGPTFTCSDPGAGSTGQVSCSIATLPSGGEATFTLVAHIPSGTEGGTFFTNIANVTTATLDLNEENNSSSAGVVVPAPSADVSVTKLTSSDTVLPDSDVTYTIEVRNNGPDAAASVNMNDTLPGDMTFVSLTQTSGPTFSCTTPAEGAGGTITCTLDNMAAGASASFTLVGHIPSGTVDNTEYTNDTSVSTTTSDSNPDNNAYQAQLITVFNCASNPVVYTNADAGSGSLRQAILTACSGSRITFATDLFTGPITLTSGELLINKNLTIEGPGAKLLTVRRNSGASFFRLFNINSGTVTISGLTVSGGRTNTGAAIYNNGTLTVLESTVSGSSADGGFGGGIYNAGTLNLISSTVSGNTSGPSPGVSGGGGIYNGGTLTMTNSTVSGNTAFAGYGGAIYNDGGALTMTNSTIANNDAGVHGGGIRVVSGTVTLRNSIIAGNTSASESDISGAVNSAGFNLIQDTAGATIIPNGGAGPDITGQDPRFEKDNSNKPLLKDNGGPTQTHALLAGSPALDAGNSGLLPADSFDLDDDGNTLEQLPVDQRGPGFSRVADAADANATPAVDIGAFEAQVSVEDIADRATNEDTPLSFSFNVGDASLITTITATSSNQTLVPNANLNITGGGSTRTLQITPASNLSGTTTITVTVNGNNAQSMSDTFVLTVNAVSDAPVALNDSYSTAENNALSVSALGVLANDTDIDSANLTAVLVSNPANGTVALSPNGAFTYTPNAGFSGTDSFTYKANDGTSDSNVATVTIAVNDGGAFQFGSATYSVGENNGSVAITITRTGGSAGTATVLFKTSNGTATAGSDYTAVSQTVTFNDGETSKTVNVFVSNDSVDEADETVNLSLSNAGGSGQLGTPSTAVLTINDDDNPPTISVDDITVTEGDGGSKVLNLGIKLSITSGLVVKVDYATADGTAVAGSDYTAASGTVTFNPGEQEKFVTIVLTADKADEPDETFFVNLSNPQNATIADGQSQITIINDDASTVEFASANYSINEGLNNTPQGFTALSVDVTRTGDTSGAATVKYTTSDDSGGNECDQVTGFASQRCDYTFASGILRFAAGETKKSFTVSIVNDGYKEGNEVFTIQLSNLIGASIGMNNQTVVTISDDAADATPTTPAQNPYLSNAFFVRQNYLDVLGREPDQAGFANWLNVLNNCGAEKGFLGAPFDCDRAHVSHGFLTSPEVTDTGFLIHRMYEVGIGRLPLYTEYISGMGLLKKFNVPPAEQQQNLDAFLQEFTSKNGFFQRYNDAFLPSQAAQLITKFEQAAGVTLPATATTNPGQPQQYGRQELINLRANGTFTLGQTLKAFVEQQVCYDKFFERGEVTSLYFDYLRRDPSLNDPNLLGWKDWVDVFTNGRPAQGIPPRDYHHLIFGFIYSAEYRKRFGQP